MEFLRSPHSSPALHSRRWRLHLASKRSSARSRRRRCSSGTRRPRSNAAPRRPTRKLFSASLRRQKSRNLKRRRSKRFLFGPFEARRLHLRLKMSGCATLWRGSRWSTITLTNLRLRFKVEQLQRPVASPIRNMLGCDDFGHSYWRSSLGLFSPKVTLLSLHHFIAEGRPAVAARLIKVSASLRRAGFFSIIRP